MAIKISGTTVIDNSQNITNAGIVTATSFTGDGSQLTNLPGGGGNTLEATASGTLADGSKVIVNADGTVSAVTSSGSGWFITLGGTGNDFTKSKIIFDSSNNFYVGGYTDDGTGAHNFLIVKYNYSGTIQWQRMLGAGGVNESSYGIAVDSSDNVYIIGFTTAAGAGGTDILIAKYNSSGSIQWQRTLGGTNHDFGQGGIAVDSSNNVYIGAYTKSAGAGNYDFLIAKYNSSGAIQWQRTLGGSTIETGEGGIAVDSSNNVYILGWTNSTGAGGNDILIAKYNSSGSIQWQRTLGGSGNEQGYGDIAFDSSNNVYIVAETNSTGAGGVDILIAKYNSSGAIQWQRTLGGSGGEYGYGIAVDSSDNVYISGYTNSLSGTGVGNEFLMAKYNSSGAIQWQRTLGGTSQDFAYGIAVDNSGNFYVSGYTFSTGAGGYDILIAKLPDDGSLTGTHGDLTYASSSFTDSTSSLTSSTSSLTDSSSSLTSSTSSLTDSATNLTSSTTNVTSTNLTAENFIGISDASYTDGQTATIQLTGAVDDAQSSLTPGQAYYVQNDGTLSETAGSPSVFAGTALASTKLIVRG